MKKKTERRTSKRARPADPTKPVGEVAAEFAADHDIPTEGLDHPEMSKIIAGTSIDVREPILGEGADQPDSPVAIDNPPVDDPAVGLPDSPPLSGSAGPFPDNPHPEVPMRRALDLPGPIAVVPRPDEMLATIERLSKDPSFDVAKMQALIDMRDSSLDKQRVRDLEDDARIAERAFVAAFVPMQAELPVVTEKGEIWNKQHTEIVATYAKWEDINEVLKPVLATHGFMLDFETINLEKGQLQTLGFLRHVGGHVRQSQFTGAPDESGFKNATQGIGSIRSYGKRYCAQDLLNVTSRGEDDDGVKAHIPEPPEGYEAWEQVMSTLTGEGIAALQDLFNETRKTKPAFCDYATKHRSEQWSALKEDAKKATQKMVSRKREPGEEG